jgi:hypothetical protein
MATISLPPCPYLLSGSFNNPQLSDFRIRFASSNAILHVHKLVLSANSQVFKACIRNGMLESTQNELNIEPDDDEELFTELIQSMYTGKITQTSRAADLLFLASKYEMIQQEQVLIDFITNQITVENVLSFYNLDLMTERMASLRTIVSKFLKLNADQVIKQKEILELEFETFKDALTNIPTKDIEKLAQEWLSHEKIRSIFAKELQGDVDTRIQQHKQRAWTFDEDTIPENFKLVTPRRILCEKTKYRMACVRADLSSGTTKWQVEISQLSNWIGVGVGVKSVVMANSSNWLWKMGHGVWMISSNEYSWDSENEKRNYVPCPGMIFRTGDTVTLEYSAENRTLKISTLRASFTFSNVPNNVVPVVDVYAPGDCVEIKHEE